MRNFWLLLSVIFVMITSCRKDFEFEPSTGDLRFSRDTVYLDTVFTNIGSSTYTLKVYNRSDKDIEIPQIQLGRGLDSKYRMTIDGMTGNNNRIFNNVELLANDSLYVFIEVTADVASANPTDFLYTDQILFDVGSRQQKVELVTLIQDAVFLYPQRFSDGTTETLTLGEDEIYGFFLDDADPVNGNEYHFTNEKPYVIYGYAAVASGKTLNIDPGARVHFHDGSGLIVAEGGSIQAIGDYSANPELQENEIIFEGDRLEPMFSDVAGQWGAIWLTPGAAASSFHHVTIKNGVIGLYIQANTGIVDIRNSKIFDHSNFGILAQTANIYGENVVINSAGQATLACTLGGSYEFRHSTFNNNWSSSRQVALLLNNYFEIDNVQTAYDLTKADFFNCIIYGSNQVEFIADKADTDEAFNFTLRNVLLRFNSSSPDIATHPLYQFTDGVHYVNVIRNQNPRFYDIQRNKLNIDEESPAYQQGDAAYMVPLDITGATRITPPDMGAYKAAAFPED